MLSWLGLYHLATEPLIIMFLPETIWSGVPVAIVAAIGLAFGLQQYVKAQHWKRCEFIAIQINSFESNPLVRRAMYMLDFRQGVFTVEGKEIAFDTDMLIAAVANHEIKHDHPNLKETQVRLAFCDFFEGIERFHHFVESELISQDDIEPYLPYWIKRFTDKDQKGEDFIYSIWTFIDAYEYTGVRQLAEIVIKNSPAGKLKIPDSHEADEKTREWFKKHEGEKVK